MNLTKTLMGAVFILLTSYLSAQEIYSKVKIYPPKDNMARANLIGLLQIDHFMPTDDGAIVSEISQRDLAKLKATSYKYKILVPNVARELDSLNKIYYRLKKEKKVALEQSGNIIDNIIIKPADFQVKSTFGGYYSFAEMEAAMNTLVTKYPQIAQKISIGKTDELRDIWVIKISDNVTTDELNEPEVLYLGLQHPREAITGASMIFYMQYLCERYSLDNKIKDLVDNREIYIIPCFNPDGYEYNRTSENGNAGGMWRKNRVKIDSSKRGQSYDYEYGVDLNRNWGVDWANCTTPIKGSSSSCGSGTNTSASETYWGSSAFSEKETQAVRDFVKAHHIVAGFDQHAYGPYYSLPFGRQSLHPNAMSVKGQNFYNAIPALMGTYNGMRAADSYDALGYEVAGGFKDWMLMGELGVANKDTVWAMTGEGAAGGGTSGNNFWAPAGQIVNLSKGMCYQNLQLALAAGTYVDIQDANASAILSKTGNLNFTIKRLGIGNDPVKISLLPIENIQSVGSSVTVASMPVYYSSNTGSISYTLSPTIVNGQRVKYAWKVETNGYSYTDTVTKYLNPIQLLYDNMEGAFSSNWTATSNVADNWNFTALSAFEGTQSMTESPAGSYSSSTNRKVTYKNPLDLSNATAAYLSFWVKHRAENFRDKLQVQVSTNSTDGVNGTWTAIAGKTTIEEPGTLDGSTLNGKPSLTGIRDYWSQEFFDLSDYKSANLRFRLEFTSDGDPSSFRFERDEGFYIDNLEVGKTTTNLTTLPVTFLKFTGKLLPDNTVQLNWEAYTDQMHDYFEVQRSSDGSNFSSIGKGNAFPPFDYLDKQPRAGNNFYRIKQVDKDGTITYSSIINIALSNNIHVAVFPNPVTDNISIKLGSLRSENIHLQITDIQGKVMYSKFMEGRSNRTELKVDMKTWSSQTYILKVYGPDGSSLVTQKLIKL